MTKLDVGANAALVVVVALAAFLTNSFGQGSKDFQVEVTREKTQDGLIHGKLSVNGEELGACYENAAKKIPAGSYKGVLRYTSSKNFVQGPGGKLGKSGDFLLEVAGVPNRTHILFHAGNKPEDSDGCILCGPATKGSDGTPFAPATLKKLRLAFYDDDDSPKSTPDKKIMITVVD